MKAWYVFYTKSRQEKKVKLLLEKSGFEVFLPLQKVMRQWSDRKKRVEVPLFNSYIFVRDTPDRIPLILQTPGIAWNVRLDNKPAVLHSHEFDIINRIIETGIAVSSDLSVSDFQTGEWVEVQEGNFRGLKGKFLHTSDGGHRLMIAIESIGQNLFLSIDPAAVRKIQQV